MPGAAIELEDPAGDVVEEVAIVRDGDDGARVLLQEPLEPGDRLGVEMVGRLVEQEQIRRLQQQPAERDTTALAAGQRRDVGVARRQPQRVHRELEARIEIPRVGRFDPILDLGLLLEDLLHLLGGHLLGELRVDLVVARQQRANLRDALLDVAANGLGGIEPRLLRQKADADAIGRERFAEKFPILAGHDAQQRALPRAVRAEDADLGAGQKRQPDVLEDDVVGRMNLPETLHGVDELHGG